MTPARTRSSRRGRTSPGGLVIVLTLLSTVIACYDLALLAFGM